MLPLFPGTTEQLPLEPYFSKPLEDIRTVFCNLAVLCETLDPDLLENFHQLVENHSKALL